MSQESRQQPQPPQVQEAVPKFTLASMGIDAVVLRTKVYSQNENEFKRYLDYQIKLELFGNLLSRARGNKTRKLIEEEIGVNPNTLVKWELCERVPDPKKNPISIAKIAQAYNIDEGDLQLALDTSLRARKSNQFIR